MAIDGDFNLACDSLCTMGDYKDIKPYRKIVKLKKGKYQGWFLCYSGDLHIAEDCVAKLEENVPIGANDVADGDNYCNLFLVSQEEEKVLMMHRHTYGKWRKHRVPCATGTGSSLAMAAMLAGASAERAVRAAIKMDLYSGGRVASFINPRFT